MDIPIKPEVLQKIAEYINTTQAILDEHSALKSKLSMAEGRIKDLEKSAQARKALMSLTDLLIESQLITKEQGTVLVEKMASNAQAAREVFSNILRARGLSPSWLGSGVDSAPKSENLFVANKQDEFDDFVNQ